MFGYILNNPLFVIINDILKLILKMIDSRCKASKASHPIENKNNRKLKSIINPSHTKSYSK